MSKEKRIPELVQAFFQSCEIDKRLDRYSFFLIRQDGIVLYHNQHEVHLKSKASIGALLSGVWQASSALGQFIPNAKKNEGFRLSFDTANQGVFIIPIEILSEEYFLGLIYSDELNPALIKNKVSLMASALSHFMQEELDQIKINRERKKAKGKYLFGEISDSEIDQLFSIVKG